MGKKDGITYAMIEMVQSKYAGVRSGMGTRDQET